MNRFELNAMSISWELFLKFKSRRLLNLLLPYSMIFGMIELIKVIFYHFSF